MKIKQQEFLALTQGSMSITEYVNKFNRLARYARDDTNTEEKKKDHFLNGMHQVLKTQLSVLTFPDFED
jgi:Retrotransposon gag protein.